MAALMENLFGRNIGARRAAIIGVGVLVTALLFGVTRWMGRPVMIPLFADVPLASMGAITDKLTELAIPYELGQNGTTVLVQEDNRSRARVALAREGLPNAGRPGMELFDKPTWGMTDFTQKVNYGRALEGELQRTIGDMENVEAVQVHLALEDEALFKQNARPSKASVMLSMKGGEAPSAAVVSGVASLVASSIGGLELQHVTVIDGQGHALTSDDAGTGTGLTSRQLAVQTELEGALARKAEILLRSYVGAGNSSVQVTANLNFDKLERTTQSVDPDKQATSTEQRAEVTPGTPQQGAGYSTVATAFENSRSVENFTSALGSVKRLSVAVLVADKVTNAPVDTTAKQPAAAVITPRTAEDVARIEGLLRNALGVDSARGDVITVVSVPFDMPAVPMQRDTLPTPSFVMRLQKNPQLPIGITAIVALLILAIVMVGALKPRPVVAAPVLAAAPAYPELPAAPPVQAEPALQAPPEPYAIEQPRQVTLPASAMSTEREQAIATVDQRTDAAVRVTRNWLRT